MSFILKRYKDAFGEPRFSTWDDREIYEQEVTFQSNAIWIGPESAWQLSYFVPGQPYIVKDVKLKRKEGIVEIRLHATDQEIGTELKRDRKEEWLSKGSSEIPLWVFCNQEGNHQNIYNIKQRHFHKCLERAGLRRIRFHDLRHTFASLLIQKNWGNTLSPFPFLLGGATCL